MKKLIFSILLTFGVMMNVAPVYVSAEDTGTSSSSTASEATPTEAPEILQPDFLPGPAAGKSGGDLQDYILNSQVPRIFSIGIGLLGLTAFIGILVSAIDLLTAYGDENKVSRGKNNFKYSIIGFIIVIMSYAIVSIVVSIALPQESADARGLPWFIPTAHAVDIDSDPSILLPDIKTMIEDQDEQGRVSLPSGDFLGEVVPSIVTNVMYFVGFLIFIALIYGGGMIVLGRGNEEEVEKAKNIVLYCSLALAMISLGYAIIYGIANLNLNNEANDTTDDVYTESNYE